MEQNFGYQRLDSHKIYLNISKTKIASFIGGKMADSKSRARKPSKDY